MALKTVNVTEETKRFLDVLTDVMGETQDSVVQMALYKFCPVDNWRKLSSEELVRAVARLQSRRLRFMQDLAMADKYGLSLSEVGNYHPDLDGIRDYDEYCRRFQELIDSGELTTVTKEENTS